VPEHDVGVFRLGCPVGDPFGETLGGLAGGLGDVTTCGPKLVVSIWKVLVVIV
jgi:hypothetical protein